MLADGRLAEAVDGHDEDPRRALEGVREARGVVEITPADADAPLLQSPRLLRVADTDADPPGGDTVEQPLHDGPTELTVGPGDDDHDILLLLREVSSRLSWLVLACRTSAGAPPPRLFTLITVSRYHWKCKIR